MPESSNPYMDPNFDPNGYAPNNPQMGFPDGVDPYMQQGDWGQQGMMGAQQPFADGMQQGDIFGDYVSPGSMMSAQDIYASQAAQITDPMMPGAGAAGAMGDAGYYGAGAGVGAGFGDPSMGYDPMGGFAAGGYADSGMQQGAGSFGDSGAFPMQQGAGFADPYQADPFGQQAMSPAMSGQISVQQPSQGAVASQGAQAQMGVQPAAEQAAAVGMAAGVAGTAAGGAAAQQPGVQKQVPAQQAQPKQQPQPQQQRPQQGAPAPGRPGPAAGPEQQRPQQGAPRRRPGIPVNPELARPGKAKMALVLAILSVVFSLVAPVGFVLSLLALHSANSYKRNGGNSGAGDAAKIFSIAGLVFSSLMLALIIWFFGYYLGYGEWSFMYTTPITYFNNSPIGQIFSLPVPSN